jgi:UPF0755 protein
VADTHDPILDLPEDEGHDQDLSTPPAGDDLDLDAARPAPVFTADPDADDYLDDDEFVRIPRTGSPLLRGLLAVGIGVLIIGGLLFTGWSWFRTQIDGKGVSGETAVVTVEPGSTVGDVAGVLQDSGVIENATMFRYWLTITGKDPVFQAGDYDLLVGGSFQEALDQLDGGPAPPDFDTVTVPEGLRAERVYEIIGDGSEAVTTSDLAAASVSGEVEVQFKTSDAPPGLEGFLFPETYQFDRAGATATSTLQRMVDQFDTVANDVGLSQSAERVLLEPYQAVIAASLIEKETAADEERGKVARVIYNRLAQGIPLGIDASLIYVIEPLRTFSGQPGSPDDPTFGLTESELDFDTPYNTRIYEGLPPTPIASPGRASLIAALNPEEGPWLYYVLKSCDGTHLFTDSASEFENQKAASRDAGILDGSGC